MKNIIRILTLLIIFMSSINISYGFSAVKLEKLLKTSDLNETATVAISIRNTDTNKVVYEQNQKKLLHPSSVLKIFTTYAALDVLSYDYYFKTQFYKDSSNNLYIKLGADPMLTTAQLKQAVQKIKESDGKSFKNLYIDDSIIDKKEFAPGWMLDDDINPYTPKVSSYNLDRNVINVNLSKPDDKTLKAIVKSTYPISIISTLNPAAKNEYLDINRYNWQNPEVVEIYGNIKSQRNIEIPISSMRRYFIHNLLTAIDDNHINISGTSFASKLVPDNAELITEIANPITPAVRNILQNSNNLMSESIYKIASAKKYNATGSDELSSLMFKEFYQKNGLETDNIIIKDGCGVSRNNLINADWITLALNKLYKMKDFEKFKDNMSQSGDGTLLNRLLDLRGEVWLKTGSLSNISSIAGYVKSQDGSTYSVAILIQNFTLEQKEIKNFEDEIINIIYNR
ncbi:MAG: D-alanyl-D-alanine carboxypeptidase/D-alanyl-D-alanine-endopeptidase [Candidatus Gastranaerophilales bacterium]|nr:D-alanyl-D-alanine carboxypeptidase/D-alanyl-D-alanine-endopeptidase [Candidatus Gastranaerophilales bacterium]